MLKVASGNYGMFSFPLLFKSDPASGKFGGQKVSNSKADKFEWKEEIDTMEEITHLKLKKIGAQPEGKCGVALVCLLIEERVALGVAFGGLRWALKLGRGLLKLLGWCVKVQWCEDGDVPRDDDFVCFEVEASKPTMGLTARGGIQSHFASLLCGKIAANGSNYGVTILVTPFMLLVLVFVAVIQVELGNEQAQVRECLEMGSELGNRASMVLTGRTKKRKRKEEEKNKAISTFYPVCPSERLPFKMRESVRRVIGPSPIVGLWSIKFRVLISSKQVGFKQLDSKQVGFKQLGVKQVGLKQLGLGVKTRVYGVQFDKRVRFEVELQGAQENREAEIFRVSNDDAAVAQRWLKDKRLKKNTNTDCLVKEQKKVYLYIKVGANIMVTIVPGKECAEGNVVEKKKVESMEANLGGLLKYNACLTK
ncbi:hypothetical protein Tco_1253307 [Tanacetum coccineum]